jgi:hypothetical protein
MTGFKCRRGPTLVEKRFEPPTLFQAIAISQSKSSSVFNQLRRFRLDRNFGRRSAPLLEADGDPLLEAPRNGSACKCALVDRASLARLILPRSCLA